MRKRLIPKGAMLLQALLSTLLLSACAGSVRIATPDPDRAAEVAEPDVPAGEAVCTGGPCLSDRQSATLLTDYAAALGVANGKLAWLRDWILGARKKRRMGN